MKVVCSFNLAINYLGTPATSIPSERVFSKAGEIISRLRVSLKPSIVDVLYLFLKFLPNNLPAVDE